MVAEIGFDVRFKNNTKTKVCEPLFGPHDFDIVARLIARPDVFIN